MNMRKIIAVLASALLLCTAIPMGALTVVAAPGDVIIDADFNDGMDGFNNHSVIDGALVIDGTSADWANSFIYAGFKPGVKYQVTFSAKADAPQSLGFKINNGWAGTNVSANAALTTEYAEYELFLTPDANLVEPIFTIQTNTEAPNGTIFYIDWVKVVEYKEPAVPGKIVNGDFETGDLTGWEHHQSTAISTDAHNGSYAANIKGNGGWGGMLNQDIPVEAGKTYEISLWVKAIANGANIQIQDGPAGTKVNLANQWFTATEWTNIVWEVIPTTDVICINFCGGGNGIAEDVLVDDITVTELKAPSFDGYITNGDFETGETTPWDIYGTTAVNADAAKDGEYGMLLSGGGASYGGIANQDYTVEIGKTYVVRFDMKVVNAGINVQIKNDGANVKSEYISKTEWATYTYEYTATATNSNLNFCGSGIAGTDVAYLDNVMVYEKVDQPENTVVWNTDFNDGEEKFNSGDVVAEGPDGSNCFKWTANGGWSATYITVRDMDPNKDYSVTMKVKASVTGNMGITIQNGDWGSFWNAPAFAVTTEWQDVVYHIPANSIPFTAGAILFKFQDVGVAMDLYIDDMAIVEGLVEKPEPVGGYLTNGDFETGNASGWENLWGSCTTEIVEGMDSSYALSIVSGQWKHVRQTGIAVNPNTDYKITLWAKNSKNMSVLVKDGADAVDIINKGVNAGEEWTKFTFFFNSGDYSTVIVSLMGNDAEAYGTFDNVVMEKPDHVCDYVLDNENSTFPTCETEGSATYTCSICGDSYTEDLPAYHNGGMEYTPAKEAIDCANPGNIENYYCPGCNEYFADAYAQEIINPWYIEVTVDCVKPEGLADCAGWTCETCGNENFGAGEHDVLICQGGTCSKCNAEIEGVGCQNYDTPACEDGVCYYCGGFVAGFGHENGAWAPCCDGECSYGCGLIYPATEDHVDADGDDYCDNCWNHLACIDADADGFCDVCWSEMPAAEIVYGDVNGDSEIDILDEALLSQFINNWDVTLGPV